LTSLRSERKNCGSCDSDSDEQRWRTHRFDRESGPFAVPENDMAMSLSLEWGESASAYHCLSQNRLRDVGEIQVDPALLVDIPQTILTDKSAQGRRHDLQPGNGTQHHGLKREVFGF
jgi:hypothetical protein